ncbi:MAG: hypothetical protein RLZZ297_1945 [Chloroflexota bacterium]
MLRIDTESTWRGMRAVHIENRFFRAMFLPELGGKLWSLIDKISDREVLWHNPRTPPRPAFYGAAYDDWFCGGWDELFPNDAPTDVSGDLYPDHGEWWAMPFDWHIDADAHAATLRMRRRGVVTDTTIHKVITITADAPSFAVDYTLHNNQPAPLDYLWKLHPALAINAQSRIDLPATTCIVDAGFRGRLGADVERFTWPLAQTASGSVDMRVVPPQTDRSCDFYYGTELSAGWCALTDGVTQSGFGIAFDPEVFRSVWVFGAYGGWRNHYTTILEPCTGYPYRLEDAIAQGSVSRIAGNSMLQTGLTVSLYQNAAGVTHIDRSGTVTTIPVKGHL